GPSGSPGGLHALPLGCPGDDLEHLEPPGGRPDRSGAGLQHGTGRGSPVPRPPRGRFGAGTAATSSPAGGVDEAGMDQRLARSLSGEAAAAVGQGAFQRAVLPGTDPQPAAPAADGRGSTAERSSHFRSSKATGSAGGCRTGHQRATAARTTESLVVPGLVAGA